MVNGVIELKKIRSFPHTPKNRAASSPGTEHWRSQPKFTPHLLACPQQQQLHILQMCSERKAGLVEVLHRVHAPVEDVPGRDKDGGVEGDSCHPTVGKKIANDFKSQIATFEIFLFQYSRNVVFRNIFEVCS